MPDADIVHKNVPRRYQKLYKEICEDYWDNQDLGHEALRPLQKDIKDYGDGPIELLNEFAARLELIASHPLFASMTDWAGENVYLEELRYRIRGNKRGLDLAVNVCRGKIQQFREGLIIDISVRKDLIANFFMAIYRANFEEKIQLTPQHYLVVDPDFVQSRLTEIRPFVEAGIEELASKVADGRKVSSVRLPINRRAKMSISLNDDILSI